MRKAADQRNKREQFWRQFIRDQQRSRSSIKAFCQSRGVSEPSFFAWRKKLALSKSAEPQADFVAVRVTPESIARSAHIEIVLDRNRTVRVVPGFDRQALREVLALLEERPC
jgi:transposase-like protein